MGGFNPAPNIGQSGQIAATFGALVDGKDTSNVQHSLMTTLLGSYHALVVAQLDSSGSVVSPTGSSSSVADNTATVTTAGVRVQLPNRACQRVYVQAHEDNNGTIVIGANTVVAAKATRRGKAYFPTQGDWHTDTNTTYLAGQGLTLLTTSFRVNAVLTGSTFRVSTALASSGTLVADGNAGMKGTLSGNVLHGEKGVTSSGQIVTETSFSGASIFGLGLGDCSNTTTSKVVYNSTTGKFLCATDQTGAGGGLAFATASGVFVNQAGDTMTGALTIALKNGTDGMIGLKLLQTMSGNYIHTEKLITSSGAIIAESGATVGYRLTAVGADTGAQLALNTVTGAILGALIVKNSAGQVVLNAGNDGRIGAGIASFGSGAMEVGLNQVTGRRSGVSGAAYGGANNTLSFGLQSLTNTGGSGLSTNATLPTYDRPYMYYISPNKTNQFSGKVNDNFAGPDDSRVNYRPRFTMQMATGTGVLNYRFIDVLTSNYHINPGTALTLTPTALSAQYFGIGFQSGVQGGKWLCCSGDGSNHSCKDMGIASAANTEYLLDADFSQPNVLVCTVTSHQTKSRVLKTNNLPSGTTSLAFVMGGAPTALNVAARSWLLGRYGLEQN